MKNPSEKEGKSNMDGESPQLISSIEELTFGWLGLAVIITGENERIENIHLNILSFATKEATADYYFLSWMPLPSWIYFGYSVVIGEITLD